MIVSGTDFVGWEHAVDVMWRYVSAWGLCRNSRLIVAKSAMECGVWFQHLCGDHAGNVTCSKGRNASLSDPVLLCIMFGVSN